LHRSSPGIQLRRPISAAPAPPNTPGVADIAIHELRSRVLRAPDIATHRFALARRGYQPDEVRAYLERLAAEVERLQQELQRHRAHAEILEHRNRAAAETAYSQVSQGMVDVMQVAEAAAARVRSDAEAEGGRIVAEARHEAERLLAESRHLIGQRVQAASRNPSFRPAPDVDVHAPANGVEPEQAVAIASPSSPAPAVAILEPTPPDPDDFNLDFDLFGDADV
jgi:DivIVA domain-containing protein